MINDYSNNKIIITWIIILIISKGINLRTGEKGIFPLAHVVDVDYNDFDPSGVEVRFLSNLFSPPVQ